MKCNDVPVSEYELLEKEPDYVPWFCLNCTKFMFPFGLLENEELSNLYDFDLPSWVD